MLLVVKCSTGEIVENSNTLMCCCFLLNILKSSLILIMCGLNETKLLCYFLKRVCFFVFSCFFFSYFVVYFICNGIFWLIVCFFLLAGVICCEEILLDFYDMSYSFGCFINM